MRSNPGRLLLALAIIGIVFISGCIQQTPASEPKSLTTPTPAPQSIQPAPDVASPQAAAPSVFKFEWTKDPGTRVSDGSVPYVHRLKDGRFRLYYCGAGGILSSISMDGLNFEKEPGVRIAPVGGSGNVESMVCDATVIDLPDGKTRMYYKGANGPGGPGHALHKVLSAISSDGLNFQKEGLNFQKETGARVKNLVDPALTILLDGKYLLLAVILPPPPNAPQRSEQPQGIYSFTSDDGLTFGDQQPVIQEGGVYDPSIVMLSNDTYRVFYGEDIGRQAGQPNIVTKSIVGRLR